MQRIQALGQLQRLGRWLGRWGYRGGGEERERSSGGEISGCEEGCSPGREVVARSQLRGTLKRRAFVAHVASADVAPAAGQEVFHSSDAEQPAGTIAQAAPAPGGGWDVIVSLQLGATADGTLTLGGSSGPVMTLAPLPYPLLEDI